MTDHYSPEVLIALTRLEGLRSSLEHFGDKHETLQRGLHAAYWSLPYYRRAISFWAAARDLFLRHFPLPEGYVWEVANGVVYLAGPEKYLKTPLDSVMLSEIF